MANLRTVTIIFYLIFFFLKKQCCNLPGSVLGVLGTYTAMSLDVVQTILCVQHSRHIILMVWGSWCMLIQWFFWCFIHCLKILYLWNTFQCIFSLQTHHKRSNHLLLSRLPQMCGITKEDWNTAESYWLHCICSSSLFAVARCSKCRGPIFSYLLTKLRLDKIRI